MRLLAHDLASYDVVLLEHTVPLLPVDLLPRLAVLVRLFVCRFPLLQVVDSCAGQVPERHARHDRLAAVRPGHGSFGHKRVGSANEGEHSTGSAAVPNIVRRAVRHRFRLAVESLAESQVLSLCLCRASRSAC